MIKKGSTIKEVAEKFGYNSNTLGYKLRNSYHKVRSEQIREIKPQRTTLQEIKGRFAEGDIIYIKNRKSLAGNDFSKTQRCTVVKKYKHFMLVMRKGAVESVRECISYADIHCGHYVVTKDKC